MIGWILETIYPNDYKTHCLVLRQWHDLKWGWTYLLGNLRTGNVFEFPMSFIKSDDCFSYKFISPEDWEGEIIQDYFAGYMTEEEVKQAMRKDFPDKVVVVRKKIFALFPEERDKPCIEHQFYWTGTMPCTGVRRCVMCGYVEGT
jgi:hypothetical protein